MQTTISARHGHLSSATQEKITEKVDLLRKFFDRLTAISVTVDVEHRDRPILELRVRAEHHDEFVAVAFDPQTGMAEPAEFGHRFSTEVRSVTVR